MNKETVNDCVTNEGLLVSGNGILCNNTSKIIELLEKIDKKLYFMEKRQQMWYDHEKQDKGWKDETK